MKKNMLLFSPLRWVGLGIIAIPFALVLAVGMLVIGGYCFFTGKDPRDYVHFQF